MRFEAVAILQLNYINSQYGHFRYLQVKTRVGASSEAKE